MLFLKAFKDAKFVVDGNAFIRQTVGLLSNWLRACVKLVACVL